MTAPSITARMAMRGPGKGKAEGGANRQTVYVLGPDNALRPVTVQRAGRAAADW